MSGIPRESAMKPVITTFFPRSLYAHARRKVDINADYAMQTVDELGKIFFIPFYERILSLTFIGITSVTG